MTIRIRQQVIDDLIAHARGEAPNECCGLLIGTEREIEEAVRARNTLQSPTKFYLEPADHFEAIRLARRSGRIVCGSYHSHPKGPSHPSATDAEQLDDPDMLLVIVSLADDGGPERTTPRTAASIGVFRWADGNFSRIDFVPVP